MIILCTAAPGAPPVKKNVVNENAAPHVKKKKNCPVGFVSQFFPTGYTRLLTDISALIH